MACTGLCSHSLSFPVEEKRYELFVLFVSGCRNHCKDCFQPETWTFEYGNPFTGEVEDEIIASLKPDYIRGLTLLGGDPF